MTQFQRRFLLPTSPKKQRKWGSTTNWNGTCIPNPDLHKSLSLTVWQDSSPSSFVALQCISLWGRQRTPWPTWVCSSLLAYQQSTRNLGALHHSGWKLRCSPASLSPHRHRYIWFDVPGHDQQPSLGKTPTGLVLACLILWSDWSTLDL
jgi:hypothetical protein